jgi:hypothetical protein
MIALIAAGSRLGKSLVDTRGPARARRVREPFAKAETGHWRAMAAHAAVSSHICPQVVDKYAMNSIQGWQ